MQFLELLLYTKLLILYSKFSFNKWLLNNSANIDDKVWKQQKLFFKNKVLKWKKIIIRYHHHHLSTHFLLFIIHFINYILPLLLNCQFRWQNEIAKYFRLSQTALGKLVIILALHNTKHQLLSLIFFFFLQSKTDFINLIVNSG